MRTLKNVTLSIRLKGSLEECVDWWWSQQQVEITVTNPKIGIWIIEYWKYTEARCPIFELWGWCHKLIYALRQTICTLRQTICTLRPTFVKLFTGTKVWCKAQKIGVGHKTVYEIDPWLEIYDVKMWYKVIL